MASYLEKSGRYSEMSDFETTIPAEWEYAVDELLGAVFDFYTDMIHTGTKKEDARQVLPLCTKTRFYWTVNLRSLMNFLSQREDEHAQADIHENAKQVFGIFQEHYPTIAEAWRKKDLEVKAFLRERRRWGGMK
jgi:thymidylate synthase (FAD)